jgi:hypothetical protein
MYGNLMCAKNHISRGQFQTSQEKTQNIRNKFKLSKNFLIFSIRLDLWWVLISLSRSFIFIQLQFDPLFFFLHDLEQSIHSSGSISCNLSPILIWCPFWDKRVLCAPCITLYCYVVGLPHADASSFLHSYLVFVCGKKRNSMPGVCMDQSHSMSCPCTCEDQDCVATLSKLGKDFIATLCIWFEESW